MKPLAWALGLVMLSIVPLPVAAQTKSLSDLLSKNGTALKPEASVDIVGWIERDNSTSLVRVSLQAQPGARLVADPGISIRPVEERLGVWQTDQEISHWVEGQAYFMSAQTVDVGSVAEDGLPIHVDVHFAYCLVDDICLFGEERVEIQTQNLGN